jgi:chaperonin GroEL
MEEIYFNKEGRDKLIEGVNKLNRAVSSTMGPNGKNVIIPDRKTGEYRVTKDGVSVAREIFFKDSLENIGAQLAKQAAEKTVEDAGDGTTTATVLTTAFVNNLCSFEFKDINTAFNEIIPKVIEQLKLNSRKLEHKDITHVASISANNDLQIGEFIQNAFNHSDIVKIEESSNTEDVLDTLPGILLPVSYFSKHFINNPSKGSCELTNVNTLIIDGKLEKLENFRSILELTQQPNNSLLIIVEDIHEQALRKLETFVLSQQLPICVIKSPGFSRHRKDLLEDLSIFTGSTLITDLTKSYNTNILGKLQSCKISKNSSILVKKEDIDVSEKLNVLKTLFKDKDLTSYDKDLIKQRIEYLKGKVSIIKVGGKTETEMKERYDRYDDAVKAVACALEEGIVEGGGIALFKVQSKWLNNENKTNTSNSNEDINKCVYRCLLEPAIKILENKVNTTYSLTFDLGISMFKENIIDPLKVTRCALLNAVAVAKTILSTEAIVLNQNEWMK